MDAIDRKIIKELQLNSTISINELAYRVGLSQTPCWTRVQKLEAAGVILRRVALVDPDKIGMLLTAFVEIVAPEHSADWLERFSARVAEMPEVMDVFRMAGDYDYLLRIVAADMAAFDSFYKRLISENPPKKVTTRFAIERVKQTTAYPIPAIG